MLLAGAEVLVRGAAGLAAAAGISQLVIGLTVVAVGTSSPEIAVGIAAAMRGQGDLALGNVVGSNIFNLLAVLGLAAVTAPLLVPRQLLRFDLPVLVAATLAGFACCLDGALTRSEGGLLVAGLVLYLARLLQLGRDLPGNLDEEPTSGQPTSRVAQVAMLVAGLVMLVLGSDWMVKGAVAIAQWFGISELVIGLTVIAIGTSLPEVAASVAATRRGHRDLAVGNAVGSNLFNLLAVLGLAAIFAPRPIAVPPAVLTFDGPVMLAVTLVSVLVFWRDERIDRCEGWLLLSYYAAFLIYVVLHAVDHPALAAVGAVLTAWLLVSGLGFALAFGRWRRRANGRA